MSKKTPLELGRRKRQILRDPAALGEASVAQVREHLADAPSYSAVRTMLGLLVSKGWVKHRQEGKRYVYRPAAAKEQSQRTALRRMLGTFFGGSAGQAVMALLDLSADALSDEELARVKEMIDRAASRKPQVIAQGRLNRFAGSKRGEPTMLMVHWLLDSAGRSELLLTLLTTWATLALGLTWLTALLLRRAVPALRYCVWQFGLLSLLAVPLVFAALPGVPLGFSLSAVEAADPPAALPAEIANRVSDAGNGSLARAFADDQPRADFSAWHPPTNAARPASAASSRLASDSRAPRVAAVAAEAPSVRGWPSLLAAIWLCGAALQALGLITSAVLARGLLRSARPLDDERFRRAADDLRRRLSLTRQVQLFQSERVGIPIVVGVLRPRVLLPADCRNWSSRRMEMVLLHELAHIERRDLAWLLSARLVATVYWFHPLVWLALVRMRLECERACDDRVLLAGMEPTDYAQGLVECASARRGRSLRLTLGIAMAQPSQLESRVRSILDASLARGPASARMRRGLLLAAACLVFGLGIVRPFSPRAANAVASEQQEGTTTASAAQPPAPASIFDDQGTQPTNGKLRLLVTDADGKPLEGVKIRGDVWAANETSPAYPRDHSDADGRATIELPARLSILRLWFSKDGYVSTSERWEQHPAEKRRARARTTDRGPAHWNGPGWHGRR